MNWPCTTAAIVAVAARLAILPWLPAPEPRYHDEFGCLLGAETFASGRLTNPVHPMWRHFETMHVNMQPTYQMKYPPAQGLVLAAGQVLFGHPWAGVLLAGGAMAAATCWMLLAWLPTRWAFGTALVLMIKTGVLGYWMNSYWGGSVAAAAGAIVLGACARFVSDPRPVFAVAAALGAIVLANSRPFEGAVLCLITAAVMARATRWRTLYRLAAPILAVLTAGGAAMAYYNYRVTGHATVMPYQEHQRQYAAAPVMIIQPDVRPPAYRHAAIRRFWEWDRSFYLSAVEYPGYSAGSLLIEALPFFLSIPLVPGLIWGIRTHPKSGALLAIFFAALCLERWLQPHYLAPAAGMIALLTASGFRAMNRGLAAVLLVAAAGMQAWNWKPRFLTGYDAAFVADRDRVMRQLTQEAGKDLVLVRYGAGHSIHDEWVYNSADIDSSEIVWAREMTLAEDRELLSYYSGRRVWRLEAGAGRALLTPYEQQPTSASPNAAD